MSNPRPATALRDCLHPVKQGHDRGKSLTPDPTLLGVPVSKTTDDRAVSRQVWSKPIAVSRLLQGHQQHLQAAQAD